MSKQTLAFIVTWTNNTQSNVSVTGLYAKGNNNWNDTNGSGLTTLNSEYTMLPGQSITITSNVEDCNDDGYQYISLMTNGSLFAQTYLGWSSDKYGGNSTVATLAANGEGSQYNPVTVQTNMNDNSYTYPWGAGLCYLNSVASSEYDGTCIGGFASGNNIDANMSLCAGISINGLTPEEVIVTGIDVNYPD